MINLNKDSEFNLIFRTNIGTTYERIPCNGKKTPNLNEVRAIAKKIGGSAKYSGFTII